MVAYLPFTFSLVELALSTKNIVGQWTRSLPSTTTTFSTGSSSRLFSKSNQQDPSATGRGRYGRAGKKKNVQSKDSELKVEAILKPPPLTWPNSPRPTYFTCRHTYETTLMDEIERLLGSSELGTTARLSTPAPGLVRLDPSRSSTSIDEILEHKLVQEPQNFLDPVYALQILPTCVVVSADSIKGLAQAVLDSLLGNKSQKKSDDKENESEDLRCEILREGLRQAPRSTLAIHGLVPGMFKGQKNPILERRSQKLAEELATSLRKAYPAARKGRRHTESDEDPNDDSTDSSQSSERWLLQLLLMTPDVVAASLVRCDRLENSSFLSWDNSASTTTYWPNWIFPAGLAKVDITDEVMPSSAYRKLMEAFECMGIRPDQSSCVYDLGACPGGWTWILRHYLDCSVIAIDRSELDPRLMKDSRIDFVQGDAFAFEPKNRSGELSEDVWMVSDIIAFPDRILELLNRWCGGKWATYMIVTMKFHGSEPDFPALQEAIDLAIHHGYKCRAKHFFNNKNEVTLMVTRADKMDLLAPRRLEQGILGNPIYSAILPTER